MKPTHRSDEIVQQLQCARAQLSTVVKMVEDAGPCAQVIQKLISVSTAIHGAGVEMILSQARSSREILLRSISLDERNTALKELQSLYTFLIHYANHHHEVFDE